jgi:hypothetical protein
MKRLRDVVRSNTTPRKIMEEKLHAFVTSAQAGSGSGMITLKSGAQVRSTMQDRQAFVTS